MTGSVFQVAGLEHHPARIPDSELIKHCTWTFLRRSGPGGQHRNKVETAALITHVPSGISAEANKSRSQETNRQEAVTRLRLKLACEIRCQQISAEQPSELWRSRIKGTSVSIAADHRDFPSLLAEAMDALVGNNWDHTIAADKLGISSTQLIKFLAKHPPALQKLNATRSTKNLAPLKPT
jgi:RF-1 domain